MLRRLPIRHRLGMGFGLVLVLMSLVAGIAAFGFWVSKSAVDRVNERLLPATHAVATLHTRLLESRILTTSMVAATLNGKEVARLHGEFQAKQKALDDAATRLAALVTSDEAQGKLKQFGEHVSAWRKAVAPTIATLEKDGFPDATEAGTEMNAANPSYERALALTGEAERMLSQAGNEALAHVQSVARLAAIALAAGFVLAIGVGALLAWRISASVVQPIEQAARMAEAIAAGDLSRSESVAPGNDGDEAARMVASLGKMQQSLRDLVGQVLQAAQNIQLASREVASGNADLSQRTEETASQLQRTASSMQQLTGSVHTSSASAQQADQLAGAAAGIAQQGGQAVSQVVAAMDDIQQRSRKIGDITSVIDGIAFQTNILALNAAVEAARAGEQGRGFAVVAGEVRALAQRAAEAAREIKALIGASVERVEDGTRLVGDAGQTMSQLVASVQRVSEIMNGLTRVAAEQSSGIGEVNSAVAQLDDATQRNAALVEQSAAAAQSLNEQASRLAQLVSVFRLEGAARA